MMASRIDNRGVIALITVIIIGALLLMVGLTTARLGQSQLIVINQADKEQWARQHASGCLEEALFRIRKEPTYSGSTVPIDGYSCIVTVTGLGINRQVVASADVSGFTKSITADLLFQSVASGGAAWTIESWKDTDPQP